MRLSALLCLLLALPVQAADFQSVASIRAAALSTLDPATEAEASVDASLRLPACPSPLQARATGNRTVEVACPQAGGWKLFVPVTVRREQDVLVLTRGVGAGEVLAAADIGSVRRDTARIAGAVLSDPQSAIGRVARRAMGAGTLLSAGDLVSPRIIRRGDSVALVSRRGGVEVRVAGKALADAGEADRVPVENLSSRRVVQGVATASGDVLVSR
ncbi:MULTISPECIES: flagellar basal body P-ring formation chaperone FlgA [Stenotrophomonas]|jgi:flagella basal body P-ring formation protein FlgA|nr:MULTISPECIES: flagellar basal body P-ring formation chaperone FlgA [Stenotrophomonas]OZB67310.1 MAG: flagella basal body P-ring formation protein FlgA [Xanthomonadales bacterium 14-68-21]MCA7022302.1 flagellar basal body P-ring formation protein FlgA [Stenotrophomonas acidaminiphila]MCE4074420.1 flagellar basal body P-ring formation protein FlgA [Stenotrophomonas acidaminiphila]QOF96954.1 flagellar basal body P-ring formation protein FlgA [Stenotrophomonas sp. CW117]WHL17270.1 flagellar bas